MISITTDGEMRKNKVFLNQLLSKIYCLEDISKSIKLKENRNWKKFNQSDRNILTTEFFKAHLHNDFLYTVCYFFLK